MCQGYKSCLLQVFKVYPRLEFSFLQWIFIANFIEQWVSRMTSMIAEINIVEKYSFLHSVTFFAHFFLLRHVLWVRHLLEQLYCYYVLFQYFRNALAMYICKARTNCSREMFGRRNVLKKYTSTICSIEWKSNQWLEPITVRKEFRNLSPLLFQNMLDLFPIISSKFNVLYCSVYWWNIRR